MNGRVYSVCHVVAIAAALLLVPFAANANAFLDENGLTWYYQVLGDDSAVIVNRGDNTIFPSAIDPDMAVGAVTIPAKIYDLNVVGIGEKAFCDCTKITSVTIPASIKGTIADNAFQDCSNLEMVNIPAGVKAIGKRAFYDCQRLWNVESLDGVENIGNEAFVGCKSLTNVVLVASVIGNSAFYGCSSLMELTFSSNVTSIGAGAFRGCSKLTTLTMARGLQSIATNAFYGCGQLSGDIVFPSSLQNIGLAAFYGCSKITGLVFEESANTNATLAIGKSAFFGCSSVTNLYLPEHATNIGEAAFQAFSSLTSLKLPSVLEEISDSAFTDCRALAGVSLPETLRTIGSQSFYFSTNFVEFAIPSNVSLVGSGAFKSTKFWNDWPDNSLVVKDGWLLGVKGRCPSDVVISNGVRHVADGALAGCSSLTNLVIADSVRTVGAFAFRYCTNLVAVSIAKETNLDPTAFYDSNWLPDSEGGGEFVDPTVVVTNFFVAFDGNRGDGNMATQTFRYGVAKALSSNLFTRATYRFDGWATSPTGTVVYLDGEVVSNLTAKADDTVKLYAHWAQSSNLYYVAFEANGGSGNMATQTFVFGEAQALASNIFSRTGYDFLGWAKSTTGNKEYGDGETVLNLTTNFGSTVSLFANWGVSESSLHTQMVDGILWHYHVSDGKATIQNFSDGEFVAAIDTATAGGITVPRTLGTNTITAIGERAFFNCSKLTSIEIPETVVSIGAFSFAGCLGVAPGITIPESVEHMGSCAFSNCPNLKIVRYLGDCPDAATDLYAGTSTKLISGVLRVRKGWATEERTVELPSSSEGSVDMDGNETSDDVDDDDASSDNGSSSAPEPDSAKSLTVYLPWPQGKYSRPVLPMTGVTIYVLQFRSNSGEPLDEDEGNILYYVPGRVAGELPTPSHSYGNAEFVGWFTAPVGGVQFTEESVVNRSYVLYAHWGNSAQRNPTDWTADLYDDSEDLTLSRAVTYDGYVYETMGTNTDDSVVCGLVTVKVGKGKYNREEEETNATVTASVKFLGGGKLTLKGKLGLDGTAELVDKVDEHDMALAIDAGGFVGSLDGFEVSGARNRFSSGFEDDVYDCKFALQQWQRTWAIALPTGEASGDAAALAHGVSMLTVSVGAKGKTKVKGTMADGTKVSVASQLLVGDGCCCVPVLVPLYSGKKGGFAFLLWLSEDNEGVWGLSAWDASQRSGGTFTATFADPLMDVAGRSSSLGSVSFQMDEFFDLENADPSYSPDGTEIDATTARWKLPKADAVKFSKDDGWHVPDGKEYGNPAGLKLSYTARNGTFKGKFRVFAETDAGRSKKYTANVSGIVVDGVGYGTALIKKVGSVPVKIE